jgi:glycosyltransferase involved in cell wall biosynthesis
VSLFKIPEYLAQAGICIFPSLWENFPNVCLEAMSAGRAVIGSKNGGMHDMLSSINNNWLIDPNKVTDIAEAIIYLLENDNERMVYGERCRDKILQFYSRQLVEEIIPFYKSLAN